MLVLTRRPGETLVIEPDLDTVGPQCHYLKRRLCGNPRL